MAVNEELAELDRAEIALVRASTPRDIKQITDVAEAYRVYSNNAVEQNRAASLKLRAGAKGGHILAQVRKRKRRVNSDSLSQLLDLDSETAARQISSRWQRLALIDKAGSLAAYLAQDVEYSETGLLAYYQSVQYDRLRRADKKARKVGADAEVGHIVTDRWSMYAGTAEAVLADFDDDSIDLIVTDPPYPAEFLPLWSMLAEQAARVLAPRGILVALTGKINLPEVMDRLSEHLAFGWMYCELLPGSSTRVMARHIAQAWKPWVAYTRGKWPAGGIEWHRDVLSGPISKRLYRWEQTPGPAAQLVAVLSPENGLVVDPFAGTGSYGVAALEVGRRFIGIEPDAERHAMACERLAALS